MFMNVKHRGQEVLVKRIELRGSLWLRVMVHCKGQDVIMSVTQMRGPTPLAKPLRFSAADVMCLAMIVHPNIPTLNFNNGNGEVKVIWIEKNLVLTTYRIAPRAIKLSPNEAERFMEILPDAVKVTKALKAQISNNPLTSTRDQDE